MADQGKLPYAVFGQDQEFSFLDTPERRLHLEILLRALEDATLLCNKRHKATAVNWFTGVSKNPAVSFPDVCHALELSQRTVQVILKRVLQRGELQTKGKSWRTRVGSMVAR